MSDTLCTFLCRHDVLTAGECAQVSPAISHLHRDWARPCPHLHRDAARPCPHLHRDAAHPCHICTGTGLTPCPQLPRDWLLTGLLTVRGIPAVPGTAPGRTRSVRPSAIFQLLGSVRPSASFHLLADSAVPTPLRAWRLSTARSQAAPTATCCGASVHSTDVQHAMGMTAPGHCVHRRTDASPPKHTGDSRLGAAVLRAQSSLA